MKSPKTIALFGGSFNPPHRGHYEMARRVARRKTIDEVWVLPTYRHPFGKKMTPFEERLNLCRKMFKGLKKVEVKDREKKLGGKSYTIRLIRHLLSKHPSWTFYWVMGADTYRQRHLWKDFEEIRKKVGFIVFPRGPRSPIPDVSSTELRKIRKFASAKK